MTKKAYLALLIISGLTAVNLGFAASDVVIYGKKLKDDFQDLKKFRSFQVQPCPDPEQCKQLAGPLPCQVNGSTINCGNEFTYHCDQEPGWFLIEKEGISNYFCAFKPPKGVPATPMTDSNF